MAERWRKSRPDRLTRLARAIEALGEQDQQALTESARVERLRVEGAVALHGICRGFADDVNARLTNPALMLDPAEYSKESYRDGLPTLFQINLRGRLLQLEFEATEELLSRDDFRLPYALYGALRAFNQDFLVHNTVAEKAIFYCPGGDNGCWYYSDSRTYKTGILTREFLAEELEQLI